jgi:TolB protein
VKPIPESNNVLNRIPYFIWLILFALNLVLVVFVIKPTIDQARNQAQQETTESITPTISPTITENVSEEVPTIQVETPINNTQIIETNGQNIYILSVSYQNQPKIYLFQPGIAPLTQLFDTPYHEIHPTISPDQTKIAYSAKKNGYWDIYIFDLENQNELRVTDTPAYEGSPTWSPDGQFLAYETYQNQNLDIFIQSLEDLSSKPIQLTDDLSADFSPVWAPNGREIAFVSTRTGEEEIWVARLDVIENRYSNISNRPNHIDKQPDWSTDSSTLFWSTERDGYPQIAGIRLNQLDNQTLFFVDGTYPSEKNSSLFFIQSEANTNFLSGISLINGKIILPSTYLPGNVYGLDILKTKIVPTGIQTAFQTGYTINIEWDESENEEINSTTSRVAIIPVENLDAPYPYFNNHVVEAFKELKNQTADLVGWDFLSGLERAFLPITDPASPGAVEEWLYTGRAFEFNPLTVYADLAVVVREERSGQTYWRIYLKSRYQDGSQGMPLQQSPWNLAARYNNDPISYETGGNRITIPPGYWIDFTDLALSTGWDRVSALPNWRSYFAGARFNQFVKSEGLDWFSAMRQVYPLEALKSPTPLPSITATPINTPTVRFFRSPTVTITPTETPIPTRRPTWTPIP